jgi:hypothetical protein
VPRASPVRRKTPGRPDAPSRTANDRIGAPRRTEQDNRSRPAMTTETAAHAGAAGPVPPKGQPRVLRHPNDVASLVLMQIDAINAKKDELTIAIKGMTDLARQLVRVYAEQVQTIQTLGERMKKLEEKAKG